MLMKSCPVCNGDGFYLVKPEKMHPYMNIANAKVRLKDGRTWAAMDWCDRMRFANSLPLAVADAAPAPIECYEYDCSRCHGTGELNWRRGKSLSPV